MLFLDAFERTYTPWTDATGAFEYAFEPLADEGGIHKVWARHPAVSTKSVQATFVIHKVWVSPANAKLTQARNYPASVPVKVSTLAGTPLTAARVEVASGSVVPAGVELTLPAPKDVAGGGSVTLPVGFVADNLAPASGSVLLEVSSDERFMAPLGTVNLQWVLTEAKPALQVSPPGLETGVAHDEVASEQVTLKNIGLAKFDDLTLELRDQTKTGPAPGWVFLASTKTPGALLVGEKTVVTIMVSPGAEVATSLFEPYTFFLRIRDGGPTGKIVADVPMYVWVDDSGQGRGSSR